MGNDENRKYFLEILKRRIVMKIFNHALLYYPSLPATTIDIVNEPIHNLPHAKAYTCYCASCTEFTGYITFIQDFARKN